MAKYVQYGIFTHQSGGAFCTTTVCTMYSNFCFTLCICIKAAQMGFRRRYARSEFGLTNVPSSNKDDVGCLDLFTIPPVQSIPKPLKPAVDSICYIAKHKKIEDEISQVILSSLNFFKVFLFDTQYYCFILMILFIFVMILRYFFWIFVFICFENMKFIFLFCIL